MGKGSLIREIINAQFKTDLADNELAKLWKGYLVNFHEVEVVRVNCLDYLQLFGLSLRVAHSRKLHDKMQLNLITNIRKRSITRTEVNKSPTESCLTLHLAASC